MNNKQIKQFEKLILMYWRTHDDFARQYKSTKRKCYINSCIDILDQIEAIDNSLNILGYEYNRIFDNPNETLDIKVRKRAL